MAQINAGYTRRTELRCTLAEMATYGAVIPYEGENVYVQQADGSYAIKMGDGKTPLADLPYVVNYSDIKGMKERVETAQSIAESSAREAVEAKEEVSKFFGELGVVQTTGDSPTAVMSQRASTEYFMQHDKRITNLEQGLPSEQFVTDSTVAHVKDVPLNALPFAEVSKVGGMTYKDGDTLKHAKVTEIESVGTNLFNPDWLLDYGATKNEYGYYVLSTPNVTLPITHFKENTQYSFLLTGYTFTKEEITSTLGIRYTDGTIEYVCSIDKKTTETYFNVSAAGKTIDHVTWTYGTSDTVGVKEVCIKEGTTTDYIPYTKHFLPIPEAIQALDGYGEGVDDTNYNFVKWEENGTITYNDVVMRKVFNGNESSWETYGDKLYGISKSALGIKQNTKAVCDRFENGYSTLSGNFFVGASGVAFQTDYATLKEWKSYLSEQYANGTPMVAVFVRDNPLVTDISDRLPADNYIGVEGGGTITAVNEHGFAMPSEITYQIKEASA